jgi:endoglucanase
MINMTNVSKQFTRQFKKHLPRRWLYIGALAALLLAIPVRQIYISAQPDAAKITKSTTIQAAWPATGANLDGKTTFTASIPNQSGSDYDMYWYTDGGTWNWMGGATTDQNVKRASVDVSGWTQAVNAIHFVAVVHVTGQRIATSVPVAIIHGNANPAANLPLYVNPNNPAVASAKQATDVTSQRILTRIAAQPAARWFVGGNTNVDHDVNAVVSDAAAHSQLPTLVAYDIPRRDCGGYSSGGALTSQDYLAWVQGMANGIGGRPAIVILEPDALAGMNCLSVGEHADRISMLASAVTILKTGKNTRVYLDAGHPGWRSVTDMAARLKSANIAAADGFSLNISNFVSTGQNIQYGSQISAQVGGKHFVIDTSRNGNGSNGQWCNPTGRAFGPGPSINTGNKLVDDYLWIKMPGESDGQCNGGGAAGSWLPSYAVGVGRNSNW